MRNQEQEGRPACASVAAAPPVSKAASTGTAPLQENVAGSDRSTSTSGKRPKTPERDGNGLVLLRIGHKLKGSESMLLSNVSMLLSNVSMLMSNEAM